jgi:8-oxo-dGTP diphosphatase
MYIPPQEGHLIADIPVKALIRKGDSILLVKEPDGQHALPGGRMNVGENPQEALLREIKEEIGLEIEVGDLLDCNVFTSKSGMHHFVVVFSAKLLEDIGTTQLDKKEVVSVDWVPLTEISSLPIRDEYLPIFERLQR